MKVLIVDDNHTVSETIADFLEQEGMLVDFAFNGKLALNLIKECSYDIIIMDIMMPKLDGINTAKIIRQEYLRHTPIIFLTAKDDIEDKMLAFKSGADDYITKPFSMQELSLRIKAVAKRGPIKGIGILKYSEICLDTRTNETTRLGVEIKLNKIQTKILTLLLLRAPAVVSRQELIEYIWKDEPPKTDALRSHIYALRKSLNKGFDNEILITLPKQGYRLCS
ncbi:TPA: response regulator transcription factor [Vibrio parahaemolyticus]